MGKTIRLILFYVDYCTVLYISQREQPYAVARFIWGAQNQAPAPDPRGVFEGAAEHLRGGARPPRRALPRREVPARRSSPAASPADPRAARTGPRGAGRGVEEGVRAQDASKRRRTRYLVRGFEVSRAKTSRAPFQVLRGAIDAPRVGAFGKPAGSVARGLSRLTPPKKRRPSEAILPSFDVAGSPARPAGTRGRLPLVLGRFCLFWSALSSSRPHTNPATDFYRSPPPHPFSRSHARDFLPFFPHG